MPGHNVARLRLCNVWDELHPSLRELSFSMVSRVLEKFLFFVVRSSNGYIKAAIDGCIVSSHGYIAGALLQDRHDMLIPYSLMYSPPLVLSSFGFLFLYNSHLILF